jgi:hypothetical protein
MMDVSTKKQSVYKCSMSRSKKMSNKIKYRSASESSVSPETDYGQNSPKMSSMQILKRNSHIPKLVAVSSCGSLDFEKGEQPGKKFRVL